MFLNLTACKYYTIQNDYIEDVRAGYVIINNGQCLEFFDFPFFGEFPLKFRYKDHQLMSDKLYPSGHYKISKEGDILKQKTACELDPVRKKDNSKETERAESDQVETDNGAKTQGDSDQTGEGGLKQPLEADDAITTESKTHRGQQGKIS